MCEFVFVFGSNTLGWHGSGNSFIARLKYGAKMKVAEGPQGCAYGIPVRNEYNDLLPLRDVKRAVDDFIKHARENKDTVFHVTPLGIHLNGFKHDDIAPMFALAPDNCIMPMRWKEHLSYNKSFKYW